MQIDPFVAQLAAMVAQSTGLDKNVVLAHWNAEEGIGSANWPSYNPAGITHGNSAVDQLSFGVNPAGFDIFPSPAAGAQAYAALMNTDPSYAGIRASAKTGNPTAQLNAIIQSPWDAGHYGGDGSKLYASYSAVIGSNVPTPPGLTSSAWAAPPSGGGDGSASGGASGGSGNDPYANVFIPSSNYEVVANSQKYGNILYGRRYRVIVSNANGVALDVSQLRCTFNIQKTMLTQPNFSQVVIYNLNPDTENTIINEGDRVVIEAGYEGEQYGLIFDGDIIQPIRDKEDNVTYRLTLNSLDGDRFLNTGFITQSLIKGQTARQHVDNIVSQVTIPTQLGSISDGFSKAELTRGKVVFGLAKDYLRQLAQSQNASFYVEDGKVNIVRLDDLPSGEIIDLSPSTGLIDVPVQNGQYITFKCMMNPRIKIMGLVHIDNSIIRAQAIQMGQSTPPLPLDNDGIYRVASITYVGDTRGGDWYCECQAVSQAGTVPANLLSSSGNAIG